MKPQTQVKERFFTPRKQKIWIMLGFIILFIIIYSLGTTVTNPYLKWLRIILLTIIGLPIMIFEFVGIAQIPFALTVLGLIVYLFYVYIGSCAIYYWKNKK